MEFLQDDLFLGLAALLLLASVVGVLSNLLKQPLVISFIIVGILAGPDALNLFSHSESINLLSEVGIAILLFAVGLKLDLSLIRTMGPVALATGLGQVLFTSAFGYLICMGLGFTPMVSIYVAVALTFSSTIIIVKLLSDKREIDSLHGKIALGILIVQDLLVIFAMIALTALGTDSDNSLGEQALFVGFKGVFLLGLLMSMGRWVLPKLLELIAQKVELLTLFAICWAVMAAALSEKMGLSQEMGAFVAGISLSSSHFRESIASRLVSLRDFLLLFFFVHLGSSLDFGEVSSQIWPTVILSLFVLIGSPLIVMTITGVMGYRKRTGFLTGLAIAQISEFSFILAALGVRIGHIDETVFGLITLVGLVTIGLSTYMILYSHPLYQRFAPYLGIFERKKIDEQREDAVKEDSKISPEYVIYGLGRMGQQLALGLKKGERSCIGVDFDPQIVKKLKSQNRPAIYGDAEDPEFLHHIPLKNVKWVICTITELAANEVLIKQLKEQGYEGKFAGTVARPEDIEVLRKMGADEVFCPPYDMGSFAADRLLQQQS